MKIIDVDKLFEEYFTQYVNKNKGKFTAEEWEDRVPVLYEKFSNTAFDALDGKTPETYYKEVSSNDLISVFLSHIEKGVPVSDFLLREISKRGDTEKVVSLINENNSDEIISYAISFLSDLGGDKANETYLKVLKGNFADEHKEHATELLSEVADNVKEEILSLYGKDETLDDYLVEIISKMKIDDRATKILIDGFNSHPEKTALYSAYLAKYGDDRAIPYILNRVQSTVDKADLKELKYALDALGYEGGETNRIVH